MPIFDANGPLPLLILVLAVAASVVIAMLWRVLRELRRLGADEPPRGELLMLQRQVDGLREQVRDSLDGGRLEIDRRLEETNRVVGDVQRGLGEVDRQLRSVENAAKDLRKLQDLLRSPKVRGGLGEYLLSELLAQVLPQAHFSLQHEFDGGERVDAVLRLGERLVPVDAKFPLENFQRLRDAERDDDDGAGSSARRAFRADVRRHVDAIAKRYIRPAEGTLEFAMMYLPVEALYQEAIAQPEDDGLDLFHYALSKRVVPVSPQSFYAYLQVIVLGLRGLSVGGRAREILDGVAEVRGGLARFGESFDVVGKHLANARRQMDEAGRRLARLESAADRLLRSTGTEPGTAEDSPDQNLQAPPR